TVVFDKTGTLTRGELSLGGRANVSRANLAIAAGMAVRSLHPCSRALVAAASAAGIASAPLDSVREFPGFGLEARSGGDVFRLGRTDWVLETSGGLSPAPEEAGAALSKNGQLMEAFHFDDALRPGAREAIAELRARGLAVSIISGDNLPAVRRLAGEVGIGDFEAGVLPG